LMDAGLWCLNYQIPPPPDGLTSVSDDLPY